MTEQLIAFNKTKCIQLIGGTLGIYGAYLAIGLLQQWLIKYSYKNIQTGQQNRFTSTMCLILFPHLVTYIVGSIYNYFWIPKNQKTFIPSKNSAFCAFFVLLGGITFNLAILWTSYPIVATVKSCNLLSVILVGIFCSRVTDKKLKLPYQKIIIGIIVSLGILLFKFFDPQVKQGDDKKFEWIGFSVLLISLLADGFLPDFQAQIKSKYNPKPTQMMVSINKWVSIMCGVYVLWSGDLINTINFALQHQLFVYHLVGLSMLSCVGHFIIYRMIKSFKQHIVPFIITTRKVFTVCISLIFYNHKTHLGQIIGILIVLGVVVYEFANQLMVSKRKRKQVKQNKNHQIQMQQLTKTDKQNQLSSSTITPPSSPTLDETSK